VFEEFCWEICETSCIGEHVIKLYASPLKDSSQKILFSTLPLKSLGSHVCIQASYTISITEAN